MPSRTSAGQEMQTRRTAVELNALHSVKQYFSSPSIRFAVRHHGLELHAAVVNSRTGEVDFIGQHPQQAELLDEARYPGQQGTVARPQTRYSTHAIDTLRFRWVRVGANNASDRAHFGRGGSHFTISCANDAVNGGCG